MRNNEIKSIGAGDEIRTHDIYLGNLLSKRPMRDPEETQKPKVEIFHKRTGLLSD